jgi:siroheme synthase-like protein
MANSNTLYPVFLKLENMQVLLVGAGNVGLEKLESLLGNSPAAAITIVAPQIKNELREFIKKFPACTLIERNFAHADIENKQLVVCATDNPSLHQQIKVLANARGLLVNVADTPPLCDFYLGSIVQKGDLKIAISTNGKSPTIAKRIKEVLNETLPDEIDSLLQNMQNIRNKMSGDFAEKVKQLNELTKGLTEEKK